MQLYIIRHGQRADTDPNYSGGGNCPLSPVGKKQAEHLAEFMIKEEPTALYCSSMLRSIQTALPLHGKMGKDLNVWPVFCETNTLSWRDTYDIIPEKALNITMWRSYEELPRFTSEEAAALAGNYYLLSDLPERYPGAKLTQPFPWPDAWWLEQHEAAQTRETGFARLELGLAALLQRHEPDDRVVLVCHGNAGDMLLAILLNLPRNIGRRVATANSSVARVDILPEGNTRLVYANSLDHLPPELRV